MSGFFIMAVNKGPDVFFSLHGEHGVEIERSLFAVTANKLLQVVNVVKYSSYCTRSLSFLRFLLFYSCLFRASVLEHCLCPLCCFSLDTTAKSLTLLYRGGKLRTDRAKVQCFFVGKECNSDNLSQFKRICC